MYTRIDCNNSSSITLRKNENRKILPSTNGKYFRTTYFFLSVLFIVFTKGPLRYISAHEKTLDILFNGSEIKKKKK